MFLYTSLAVYFFLTQQEHDTPCLLALANSLGYIRIDAPNTIQILIAVKKGN